MVIIAHNIRSLHNVGSIFRSAEVFDIEKVYLTGYSGAPPRKEIAKVALGSEHRVEWEKSEDLSEVISALRNKGYMIYALETSESSKELEPQPGQKIALILGNEVEGIEHDVLKIVDKIVEIPMLGKKKSLNVSVAAGIAMFELTRKKL